MIHILIYILAEVISVICSTIKSVVVVKGNRITASIAAASYYTLSAIVTYFISRFTEINIAVVICTTLGANITGVWIGLTLINKFKKDVLWRVSATVHKKYYDDLVKDLIDSNFKFVTFKTDWEKIKLVDVFTAKKEKSKLLGKIFSKYDVKYTISSNHHRL